MVLGVHAGRNSPLPPGPPAAGVWAGRSASQWVHTVPGWSCSPALGSPRLAPAASPRPACSSGCGTMSPYEAAPRWGPRGPVDEGGWATGPPGSGCQWLQLSQRSQWLHHMPREASGRPRRALNGQKCYTVTCNSTQMTDGHFQAVESMGPVQKKTHSCQIGPFWGCLVVCLLWQHRSPQGSGCPDSGC